MGPDPEFERRVLTLFSQAIELPEAERAAWIEAQTAGDAGLRTRLEALLTADRAGSLHTGGAMDHGEDERLPERIGAYRIVARIGRGGMGAVYRGERDAGDFDHVAAIKLIKPGLLSEKLVERFQRERQTLARLEHPYIARLYDGGQTGDGAPFIVMEHIDGQPILDWAQANGVSRDARLRLFEHVCEAVSHAHANLIVHRDITPANVLVTQGGRVKLIDFGIAKPAADEAEREPATSGLIARLSLTPGFAAPERMTGAEATTAGDIYSLGRLLEALTAPGAGDIELAAIIKRATAREPGDRYPTADALRTDVEALRGGMPVAAMPGGRGYLARKFVARHRFGTMAATAALALLLTAFAATLWSLGRAQTARAEAEARFSQLRSLAGYMVFDLNGQLARTVGNGAARRNLVGRAQTYLSTLAATPDATPDIRLEAARGLISLAAIQGVPNAPNFGDHVQARANLNAAITQLEAPELAPADANPELATALVARAMMEAHVDTDLKRAAASVASAEAALRAAPPAQRGQRWLNAQSAVRVGQLELAVLGQDAKALGQLAGRLDAETSAWPKPLRGSRAAAINHALSDYYRGIAALFADEIGRGVAFEKAARDRFAQLDAAQPNDPNLLFQYLWANYVGFGGASGIAGHEADAEDFLQTTRRTIDRLIALEPNDRSLYMFKGQIAAAEAQALSEKGRYLKAEAMQRSVIAFLTQSLGMERKPSTLNRLVIARNVLGNIASQAGHTKLACDSYRESRLMLSQLEAQGVAVGNTLATGPVLDRNIARCARGAPASEFEKL